MAAHSGSAVCQRERDFAEENVERVQQAVNAKINSLLANAVKFTERGTIVLRLEQLADDVADRVYRFSVSDTGIGIQPRNQTLIFDLFSQEDGSTTRQFGGTGLGLAICKQLVELMGGEIWVTSVPDEGSTFWFTVRLRKDRRCRRDCRRGYRRPAA